MSISSDAPRVAGSARPVRWWITSLLSTPPISAQAGANVAANVSACSRQAASSSNSGSRARADSSTQPRQPRRPGTNVGPTRIKGGNWLAPTWGMPAAAQHALTQRLSWYGGQSAASTTKSAPLTTAATSAGLSSRRVTGSNEIAELKAAIVRAVASAFGWPMSSSR
jgi:hypothetical protein